MIFHADSESDLKTSPNQIKNPILLKIEFLSKSGAAASAEDVLNTVSRLVPSKSALRRCCLHDFYRILHESIPFCMMLSLFFYNAVDTSDF